MLLTESLRENSNFLEPVSCHKRYNKTQKRPLGVIYGRSMSLFRQRHLLDQGIIRIPCPDMSMFHSDFMYKCTLFIQQILTLLYIPTLPSISSLYRNKWKTLHSIEQDWFSAAVGNWLIDMSESNYLGNFFWSNTYTNTWVCYIIFHHFLCWIVF